MPRGTSAFFFLTYVCMVCVHLCMHVCMCVGMCACRGQRSTLGVFSCSPPDRVRWVSHLHPVLSISDSLDHQPASEILCFCFSCADIAVQQQPQTYVSVRALNCAHTHVANAQPTELPPHFPGGTS